VDSREREERLALREEEERLTVGAGVYISPGPNQPAIENTYPLGTQMEVYDAELNGIRQAAEHALKFCRRTRKRRDIWIFTDNQAAVMRVATLKPGPGQEIAITVSKASHTRVTNSPSSPSAGHDWTGLELAVQQIPRTGRASPVVPRTGRTDSDYSPSPSDSRDFRETTMNNRYSLPIQLLPPHPPLLPTAHTTTPTTPTTSPTTAAARCRHCQHHPRLPPDSPPI